MTDSELISMTDSEIVAKYSPFLKHIPLSEEHRRIEAEKLAKKETAAAKKLAKEEEKARKAAEKEKLAAMTPEQRKAYKKKLANEKAMIGQPTLL